MTRFPKNKSLTRVTRHKKPRHQIYQPGFNASNSCWLPGDWITVPDEPDAHWKERRKAHEALYAGLFDALKRQHYRDPATAPEDMTPAEKQAWEHYSGEVDFYVRGEHGINPCCLTGKGAGIDPRALDWCRDNGWKILSTVKLPDGTIVDQAGDFNLPDDIVEQVDEPIDPWEHIVRQNKSRMDERSKGLARGLAEGNLLGMPVKSETGALLAGVAMHGLIEIEKEIVRAEWSAQQGNPARYSDPEEDKARYIELRRELKETFGDNFERIYNETKASSNSCARTNLDNSDGTLYCWVLPEFHDDGTHEPWGERDVPWGSAS